MDISEKYIRMCDCEEIQSRWDPDSGDWYFRKYSIFGEDIDKTIWGDEGTKEISILQWQSQYAESYWKATNEKGEDRIVRTDELYHQTCIWLPRQDQLQEMLIERNMAVTPEDFLVILYRWTRQNNSDKHGGEITKSMEQLWLAFVMHELYGKKWGGDSWCV